MKHQSRFHRGMPLPHAAFSGVTPMQDHTSSARPTISQLNPHTAVVSM
jgi:hypothetical protein